MTKKIRTILFIFFIFLFSLLAPATIFYSQGWRFDFQSKKITKTGAFFFKVFPKSAQIYLNDKFIKKTDFLFGTGYVENLLPKKYHIKIVKENYYPWEKTLEIKEELATEAKNIVLIPQKVNFNILSTQIDNFFPSPDGRKIIFVKKTDQNWSLSLFEIDKNIQSFLTERKGEFFDLKWSLDSKKIILETSFGESIRHYILELDKIPVELISLDFLSENIEKISFNPQNGQKLFFLKNGSLYEGNYITKEAAGPLADNILDYAILNNEIYYLDNEGNVFKADFSLRNKEKLNDIPFLLKTETSHKIVLAPPFLFLKEGSVLYFLKEDKTSFEKFFEPVQEMKISSDSKKAVYFSNNEIWVLFLKKNEEQPQKEAGNRLFITRFSEKINNVFWLTNHYLTFNSGNIVKIAEIDDRDRIQVWDVADFENPEIFFSQATKKLYILSKGNLYSSDILTP